MRLVLLLLLLLLLSAPSLAAFPDPYPPGSFGVPQWSELGAQPEDEGESLFFAEVSDGGDYVSFPMAQGGGGGPTFEHKRVEAVVHNQFVKGNLLRVPAPAKSFAVQPPTGGCPGFRRTSVTAEDAKCVAATNGGFFDIYRGVCLGNLASNGHLLQQGDTTNANFGTTHDGRLIMGYLSTDDLQQLNFTNLLSGVTWLLRDGEVYLDQSVAREKPSFEFVWMKAPRVAVGHNQAGEILILEVDGDEPLMKGLNLYEFAELAKAKGMVNAINIDGGGSATVWVHGKTVNQPSDFCKDGHNKCERMVTTILCVKQQQPTFR